MQLGFVIDQDRCIGCHACTVACKAENAVPLGVFRTWVKAVEKGTFPAVERRFAVMRCNHCASAPCAAICPVEALRKRPDGVVDLDREACVGCRACLQACPYDALHVDAATGAAGKCHFCAHRLEVGLAPACAVVCPTQAIHHGDLHDAASPAGAIVASGRTTTRTPERRTGPNVHYLGAAEEALRPALATRGATWIWSERAPGRDEPWPLPANARVVHEVVHAVPWGLPVAVLLVVKGAAAGVALLAPLAGPSALSEALAVGLLVATGALLAGDLTRPRRALAVLFGGNRRSWLVRGAWILTAAGLVEGAALVLRLAGLPGADALRIAGAALAPLVAGYSAGLFHACVGRDLWRSPAVLPRLLAEALAAGGALLVAAGSPELLPVVVLGLAVSLGVAIHERLAPPPTDNGRLAAAFLRGFGLRAPALLAGACLAVVALGPALPWLPPLVVFPALLAETHAWLRAGQLPPNS